VAKGLGKGLDALFSSLEVKEDDTVREIPIKDLRPNPYQPRKYFNEEALEELKASILEHGVIQPILVRRSIKGYDIIAGERRYRAAKAAGLATIPAVERNFTDQAMMEVALIENVQREDLNPIEVAEAYQKIMEKFSLTQEELAKKMGKSRPLVANYLRLLNLPSKIKENVSRGTISMGHAKALVSVEDAKVQLWLAEEVMKKGLSVRKLEELVQEVQQKKNQQKQQSKKKGTKDLYYKTIEEKLREKLGTSVLIKPGKKKGKIEIEYFSDGDLERIIEIIEG
jgi:ParB family chromosome partitioning protein